LRDRGDNSKYVGFMRRNVSPLGFSRLVIQLAQANVLISFPYASIRNVNGLPCWEFMGGGEPKEGVCFTVVFPVDCFFEFFPLN
jgi:hypothetical protein